MSNKNYLNEKTPIKSLAQLNLDLTGVLFLPIRNDTPQRQ